MKIALITTSYNNFGSRLQAIASIQLLNKEYPNAKVETIILNRQKSKLIRLIGKSHFVRFLFYKIKFNGKVNKDNKLINFKLYFVKDFTQKSLEFLNKKYDLFVIGSDQIWNNLNNESYFKFGMFTANKICNAPSFIPERVEDQNKLKSLLVSFKHLNVREEKTAQYVREQLGLACESLIDPTLRLTSDDWNYLLLEEGKNDSDYVFVYFLHKEEAYKKVCEQLESEGIKFISIFNSNSGNEKYDLSPLQFVAQIRDSKAVITNSFHGCCFAKIFNKALTIYKHNETSDIRYDVFKDYENLKGIY